MAVPFYFLAMAAFFLYLNRNMDWLSPWKDRSWRLWLFWLVGSYITFLVVLIRGD